MGYPAWRFLRGLEEPVRQPWRLSEGRSGRPIVYLTLHASRSEDETGLVSGPACLGHDNARDETAPAPQAPSGRAFMSDSIKFGGITLDCPNVGELAAFYAEITG